MVRKSHFHLDSKKILNQYLLNMKIYLEVINIQIKFSFHLYIYHSISIKQLIILHPIKFIKKIFILYLKFKN